MYFGEKFTTHPSPSPISLCDFFSVPREKNVGLSACCCARRCPCGGHAASRVPCGVGPPRALQPHGHRTGCARRGSSGPGRRRARHQRGRCVAVYFESSLCGPGGLFDAANAAMPSRRRARSLVVRVCVCVCACIARLAGHVASAVGLLPVVQPPKRVRQVFFYFWPSVCKGVAFFF